MSKGLSAFLAQNVEKEGLVKFVASRRIKDENGPIPWEICCITSKEDDAIRKACTNRKPVSGRRGMYTPELDAGEYLAKVAVRCTKYPDLNSQELQDSYGVMGAEDLLRTMLKPGEYTDYTAKVQEVNGFDISFEEKVEEAKN